MIKLWWKDVDGFFEVNRYRIEYQFKSIYILGVNSSRWNIVEPDDEIRKVLEQRLIQTIVHKWPVMSEDVLRSNKWDDPTFDPVYEVLYGN